MLRFDRCTTSCDRARGNTFHYVDINACIVTPIKETILLVSHATLTHNTRTLATLIHTHTALTRTRTHITNTLTHATHSHTHHETLPHATHNRRTNCFCRHRHNSQLSVSKDDLAVVVTGVWANRDSVGGLARSTKRHLTLTPNYPRPSSFPHAITMHPDVRTPPGPSATDWRRKWLSSLSFRP